jgi:hypothetical protein
MEILSSGAFSSIKADYINVDTLYAENTNITVSLPPSLQSIANLTTTSNQTLYTLDSNVYSTTGISPAGRSFINLSNSQSQRVALGLVIGQDVQAHSNTLDSLITISNNIGNIPYTVGSSLYSGTPITTYTRNNIFTLEDDNDLRDLIKVVINPIEGNISTLNKLVKVSGINEVSETTINVDTNNISNINNITSSSITTDNATIQQNLNVTGNIDTITPTERSQIANIDSVTISNTQWSYLGQLDQNLTTTSTPTFNGCDMNGNIVTNSASPISNNDLATKGYVDTVASTGAPPLESVRLATITFLPNAPNYLNEVLTSTGNPGTLAIDSITVTVGDRILVKNQVDPRENGIYTVTDDGSSPGPNWSLTRSSDFNQAATPIIAGSSVFVQIVNTASNSASSWSLQQTVNDLQPLIDSVIFIQIGGVPSYTVGNGMNGTSFSSGTIETNITSRLKYTTGQLDLNTIGVDYGGTGRTTLTSNAVLIGDGTNSVNLSKLAPSGDFVGTSDSQGLSNKSISDSTITTSTLTSSTNNIISRALFTSNGTNSVSTYAASNPIFGQILTATSSNTATWQTLPFYQEERIINVFQNAPNVSPDWDNISDAILDAISLTPSESNQILILIFPGTYQESIPITVPPYVSLSGISTNNVNIRPAVPAASTAMLILNGNTKISNITLDGFDGVASYATIGISSVIGTLGSIDICTLVTVRNCTDYGVYVQGNLTKFSKILICRFVSVQVTRPSPFVMNSGYYVTEGGLLSCVQSNASGYLSLGGVMTNGLYVTGDNSFADVNNIQVSSCINCVRVGGNTVSNSRYDYPTIRIIGGNIGYAISIGLYIGDKDVCNLLSVTIEDNTDLFNQSHIYFVNPALPADSNLLTGAMSNMRLDLVSVTGATNNSTELRGINLTELPSEILTQVQGTFTIGRPGFGSDFLTGEGGSFTLGMVVFLDNNGTFTNITSNIDNIASTNYNVSLASTTSIDLTSAPASIDGVTPTNGMLILVKNGSSVNPGTTSVDNGIYVWTSAGASMPRSTFLNGSNYSDQTYVSVNSGTTNYGSFWKFSTNVTIGTTSYSLISYSSPAFQSNSNTNAIYFGRTTLIQFPGIQLSLTKPLTTTTTSSSSVIVWEYWNGSTWTSLPLMVTKGTSSFDNYGTNTFGFGTSIVAGTSTKYQYRFGNISSTWATSTINTVNAYWIRSRIIASANITQIPIILQAKLQTNTFKSSTNGFIEYFGSARPIGNQNISMGELIQTGVAGETAATQRLIAFTNGVTIISANLLNCTWTTTKTTSLTYIWNPPYSYDSSYPLKLIISFSQNNVAAVGNVAMQLDIAHVRPNDVIGNTAGTTTSLLYTTGPVAIPISSVIRGTANGTLTLLIPNVLPLQDNLWIKLSRLGTNVLDTYADSIYIYSINLQYVKWCEGSFN